MSGSTSERPAVPAPSFGGDDARTWIAALRAPLGENTAALERLHELLLRAARHELARRRADLSDLVPSEIDELAACAADDALIAVLQRLDDFRGMSRFTTWACKFALFEAGVKSRRRAWQGRDIDANALDDETWPAALREGIGSALAAHQRDVFCALALNGVPIDVLAERLDTTRGELYATLRQARLRLRDELEASGGRVDAKATAA
jgi:RNA polymerase sigma-70 factor (ECF subfamily)